MCRELNVEQRFSSVARPQTNGQVEVTNGTLLHGLRTWLAALGGSWGDELQSVLWAYRITSRTATDETPFSLVMDLRQSSQQKWPLTLTEWHI